MSEVTIYARVSRDNVRKSIATAPHDISTGRKKSEVTDRVLKKIANVILTHIHQSFLIKSQGGTDEAGDRWAPLKPETIAYTRSSRTRTERKRESRPSQSLNAKQQKRWWDLYRQGLAMFKGNKGSAAKRAWSILKREGAETLKDKYSESQVQILRSSGELLRSLTPRSNSPHQVIRIEKSAVIIGTSVPYAMAHHNGVPGKLPQRRLWPDPNKWPASWHKNIANEMRDGVVELISREVRGL